MCGVETLNFFKVPQCEGSVLCWCVETLNFLKVLLCVGSVLWCGDFENFHSSPVWALYGSVWRL